MNDIKVSIICNVYNQKKFIEKTIDSFISQIVNFDYEILIHDDCSTDGTIDILKKYEKLYSDKIKVIFQKENQYRQNISTWLLYQIPRAIGKYIAFCDGDDYWNDNFKLQKQVDLLERNNAVFCYTDFSILYEKDFIFKKSIFKNKLANINIENPLLSFGSLGVQTWVFKRQFIQSIKDPGYFIKDTAVYILFETLRQNQKVVFLSDNTSTYRNNINSTSNESNNHLRYLHHKSVLEFMLDYFLQYYIEDDQTRHKINMLSINILSEAHDHQDVELINRIESFLKESEIDISQILSKFQERDKYKQNYESLENSRLRKILKKIRK